MKKNTLFTMISLVATLLVTGCNPTPEEETASFDAWLLNEGTWGGNNASLSALNTTTPELFSHYFTQINGRGIGDLAQDALLYGGKMYVTVSESNSIEVLDPRTGKSIQQIDVDNRYPRYLTCYDGKIYVSCYTPHSIICIDTNTLAIERSYQLTDRMQPEQICVAGDKLYVTCSYQTDETGAFVYDNQLVAIDLNTFSNSQLIEIGYNANRIKKVDDHTLCISFQGDYADNPAGSLLYDCNTQSLTPLEVALTNFDVFQGRIYGYNTQYDATWNAVNRFYCIDPALGTTTQILSDIVLDNAYGISINPHNGDLYVCDGPYGSNGDLYCFSASGDQKFKLSADVYPSKVVFL